MSKIKNRQIGIKFSNRPFLTITTKSVQTQRPIAQRKYESASSLIQQKMHEIKPIFLNKKIKQSHIQTYPPLASFPRASRILKIHTDERKQQKQCTIQYEVTNPYEMSTIKQSENVQKRSNSYSMKEKQSHLPIKIFTLPLQSERQDTLGLRKTHNMYMKRSGGTRQKIDPYLYYKKMKDKLKNQNLHQYHSNLITTQSHTSILKRKKQTSTIQTYDPPLKTKYKYKYKAKAYSQRKELQPRPWSTCKSQPQ